MTIAEDVLQSARSWLKTAASLADDQVLVEDDVGPTDPPYLTVNVSNAAQKVGQDEQLYGEDGSDATSRVRGLRRSVLELKGYGDQAHGWLAQARDTLHRLDVRRTLSDEMIDVETRGPLVDLAELVDTDIEPRFQQDYTVRFAIETVEANVGAGVQSLEVDGRLREFPGQADTAALNTTLEA